MAKYLEFALVPRFYDIHWIMTIIFDVQKQKQKNPQIFTLILKGLCIKSNTQYCVLFW